MMGHYDSCREADERYEEEQRGKKFRDIIANREDDELGRLWNDYDKMINLARAMNGTADQHESRAACANRIGDFFKRLRP